MAANELNYTDISTILNAIYKQSTGQDTALATIDSSTFVSVAQSVLKVGADNILGAISQMASNTIFSSRVYKGMFKGLMKENLPYGNWVRKINILDREAEEDKGYPLSEGSSVDQYVIKHPKVLQTNYYGFDTYSDHVPVTEEQLNTAFSSASGLSDFWSSVFVAQKNKHESWKEDLARTTLLNFMGGIMTDTKSADNGRVYHLVTLYNNETGLSLTPASIWAKENITHFSTWLSAFVENLVSKLHARSARYHSSITGNTIIRFTPKVNQKMYLLSDYVSKLRNIGFTSVFSPKYLSEFGAYEEVPFWQNINNPAGIDVKPSYLDFTTGQVKTAGTAVKNSQLFGVLFDEAAVWVGDKFHTVKNTPYNARGRYYNIWYNDQMVYSNDFTENGIVFLLD